MERRDFLKGLSAAGLLSMMDPAYLSAKDRVQSGQTPTDPVPKRQYGRAKDLISIIGFGGIVVNDVTPEEASNYVSEAVDRGINYFDVAPTYGNAQERLGPALKPYREKCFLACKTTKRDGKGAQEELEESFRLLQTDHFELYQLHAITTLEDVEQAFAKGGAMETFLKAKEKGKVRYLGFSAHSEVAAHAAIDRYDFDSILFPLSFPIWIKEEIWPCCPQASPGGQSGHSRPEVDRRIRSGPRERNEGNAAGRRHGTNHSTRSTRCHWAFGSLPQLPAHAMIPPGHWELFRMAVELAQSGALLPLNDNEREIVRAIAMDSEPIFTKQA